MKRMIFVLMGILLLLSLFAGLNNCLGWKKDSSERKKEEPVSETQQEKQEKAACVYKGIRPAPARNTFPQISLANLCEIPKKNARRWKPFMRDREYEVEYSETLYTEQGRHIAILSDQLFRTKLLISGQKILLEDPSLHVYHKKNSLYLVETATDSFWTDFSRPEQVERLKQLDKRDPRFYRFTKDYRTHISSKDQRTVYTFIMDYPSDRHPYAEQIRHWLADMVSASYVGDFSDMDSSRYEELRRNLPGGWTYSEKTLTPEKFGAFSSRRYFEWKKREYPDEGGAWAVLSATHDWRLCMSTDRFLTYQYYNFDYNGGAHGYFETLLRSFDFVHGVEIDTQYLFKPGGVDSLKDILLEEACSHVRFVEQEGVETTERLYYCFSDDTVCDRRKVIQRMELPGIGLAENGLVISYPPYALGAYVSGCFHFVVPYGRLLPYLTDRAKWCLGLEAGI